MLGGRPPSTSSCSRSSARVVQPSMPSSFSAFTRYEAFSWVNATLRDGMPSPAVSTGRCSIMLGV